MSPVLLSGYNLRCLTLAIQHLSVTPSLFLHFPSSSGLAGLDRWDVEPIRLRIVSHAITCHPCVEEYNESVDAMYVAVFGRDVHFAAHMLLGHDIYISPTHYTQAFIISLTR